MPRKLLRLMIVMIFVLNYTDSLHFRLLFDSFIIRAFFENTGNFK